MSEEGEEAEEEWEDGSTEDGRGAARSRGRIAPTARGAPKAGKGGHWSHANGSLSLLSFSFSLIALCSPHATPLIVVSAMILLDGLDKHEAPLADKNQAGPSLPPVARAHTPTPSLPDYEASQAQLKPTVLSYPEIQEKRTRRRNYRRYALYALVVYFVISVAIGVPFLVIVSIVPLSRPVTEPHLPQETQEEGVYESECIISSTMVSK